MKKHETAEGKRASELIDRRIEELGEGGGLAREGAGPGPRAHPQGRRENRRGVEVEGNAGLVSPRGKGGDRLYGRGLQASGEADIRSRGQVEGTRGIVQLEP